MSIGLVFWIIFLIAIIFGAWGRTATGQVYWTNYNGWIYAVLIFLLGWATFGFIIRG